MLFLHYSSVALPLCPPIHASDPFDKRTTWHAAVINEFLPYLQRADGGSGGGGGGDNDDDIEVMDDDVVFVKDDNTPASTPAPAAAAGAETEPETAGGESAAEAAVAGGGETKPKKTSDKENDVLGVSSAKEGVSKKRPASASLGESGDEGGQNGEEAGVASSSINGTAPKRAKG